MDFKESFSIDNFLSDYWGKKPVLIKNAIERFKCPIDGGDLAALAMESEAYSRIILNDSDDFSQVIGPFTEADYAKYENKRYTLLVNDVEHFFKGVLELKQMFRFISDWRIDDVMASYSSPGGSVGAHADYFDVFLIQGAGRKRWEIGKKLSDEPLYRDDLPVKIMKNFEVDKTYDLFPGDVLYLPPNIPHHGIALDQSITLSVGFRSPSVKELVTALSDHVTKTLPDFVRLDDIKFAKGRNPAEIPLDAIHQVRKNLNELIQDDDSLAHWFGKLVSEPSREESNNLISDLLISADFESVVDRLKSVLAEVNELKWNPAIRLSYFKGLEAIKVFIDGEAIEVDNDCLAGISNLAVHQRYTHENFLSEDSDSFKFLVAVFFELNILFKD